MTDYDKFKESNINYIKGELVTQPGEFIIRRPTMTEYKKDMGFQDFKDLMQQTVLEICEILSEMVADTENLKEKITKLEKETNND